MKRLADYELDAEFKRKRITNVRLRNMAIALDLARIREDLVLRATVDKQLTFLMKAFQQHVLSIPNTYSRRLLHKTNDKEVHKILSEMANKLLLDLMDVPQKCLDPDYLQKLESE